VRGLTVVVPYRDNREALNRLIGTIPAELPLIVVDDCSETPPSVDVIEAREGSRLIRREKRGYFSGAVNTGIEACDTDVLVLNQDITLVGNRWLEELDALRQQHAIIGDCVMGHPAWPKGYVQGTLMFLRRDAIQAVGMLDEANWPLWGATAEWQLRACRKGFSAYPIPKCQWFHHSRDGAYGSSIKRLLEQEPQQRDLYVRTPPLVSVVTACYNYGHYLPDLVASLIGGDTCLGPHPGQTFQGFEVVICDDRSTDDSWATCLALANDWKGVHITRRKANGGTAAALNTAIAAARGRYIMVMDADDMLEPEGLAWMLAAIENNPHALIYSDQRLFANGKRGELWRMKGYDFDALLERNHIPSGTMFTKGAWKEVGGYPPAFAQGRQDWAWAVRMGEYGYCGIRVPHALYLYRREKQNRSIRNAGGEWRQRFVSMMHETFPHLYKGERPMGCCGNGRVQTATVAPRKVPAKIDSRVGVDGMTLLEYTGRSVGRTAWYGPVTRTRYVFSGLHRVNYVDSRDAPDMLKIIDDRKRVFRIYEPPEEVVPVETVAPEVHGEVVLEAVVPETLIEEESEIEEAPESESEMMAIVDVGTMKIPDLQLAVKDADQAAIDAWLAQEQSGRRRVMALRLLQAAQRQGE